MELIIAIFLHTYSQMPLVLAKRPTLAVTLVLWFVFSLYFSLTYFWIRDSDETRLAVFAFGTEYAFPESTLSNFKINRRIKRGDLKTTDYLVQLLLMLGTPYIDDELVYKKVELLLASGLNIDSSARGLTPLQRATNMNHPEAVRYLLENCADPFALTNYGATDLANQDNAFKYLERLQEVDPMEDRREIAELLESWHLTKRCTGRPGAAVRGLASSILWGKQQPRQLLALDT